MQIKRFRICGLIFLFLLLLGMQVAFPQGRFESSTGGGGGTHDAIKIQGTPVSDASPTDNFVMTYDAAKDTLLLEAAPGAGSGSMTTVKEGGSQVGGSDIVTLDFGAGFDIAETPDTEINITLDLTEKQVNLATEVTGTLPEANGGTGDTDLDDIVAGAKVLVTITDGANAVIAGNVTVEIITTTLADSLEPLLENRIDTFVNNFESDVIAGTLTADGITLGSTELLTIGSQTLTHDTDDFVFNDGVEITGDSLRAPAFEFTGGGTYMLPADENITIDGRTNPRTVTLGAMRWNHTPQATTENTRALFLDVDANSVANTQGLHVNIKATSIAAGETIMGFNLIGDRNSSSGGVVRLIDLNGAGVGSAEIHGIHIEPTVDVPLHLVSGTEINVSQAWDRNGGFTDVTAAFNSSGTDVQIFSANDDTVFIGAVAVFSEVNVNLNTAATGAGIKPDFFIWTGAAYTEITPTDGTAGFRENGSIDMVGVDLSSWASNTVNSVDRFYLVIVRTQAGITGPTEDLIQTVATIDFKWESDGTMTVKTIGFEGAVNDANEHIIGGIEATADRIFNFPDDQLVAGDVLVASDASDLEYLNLATTEILIGDGSGVPTAAALSNDVTMDNAGSVTIANGAVTTAKVEAELKTFSKTWFVVDTVHTTGEVFPGWKVPFAITITEIASYTDANTVTFNIEERAETTPNTAGTDALAADQVADTNQQEDVSFDNAGFAADTWMTPVVSAAGDVEIFGITVRYTVD